MIDKHGITRPSGELKESEKKENLMKYSPILPIVSLFMPLYTQTVESVCSIAATAAYIELQSLVWHMVAQTSSSPG
eukprot:5498693-Ditylum_brightwellii.AAC.1